jgi:nucleotide-binding universal stress UspA family protein
MPKSAEKQPRIVVGVDGSNGGAHALKWAAEEAAFRDALLEIHSAWGPGYVFVNPKEIRRVLNGIVDAAAERAAEFAPGVAIAKEIHEGSPGQVLVEASDGATLLVVGSRGLGRLKGAFLGSVSTECALHARCPVLVVRDRHEDE